MNNKKIKAKIVSLPFMKNKKNVKVCLSPNQFSLYSDEKSIVVIIDILRATTVISTALKFGVKDIFFDKKEKRILASMTAENKPCSACYGMGIFEAKIEKRLLFESGIFSNNYSVDVVNGNVYVMGISSDIEEKTKVENFLNNMNDIKKLILLVDIHKNIKDGK